MVNVECNRTDSCSHDSCEHHGKHPKEPECRTEDNCEEIGSQTVCVETDLNSPLT